MNSEETKMDDNVRSAYLLGLDKIMQNQDSVLAKNTQRRVCQYCFSI